MKLLDSLLQDFRQAARQLWLAPGFTVATVLILALGIGVNTAVFSLFNATLLKTPAVREPDRLVAIWRSTEPGEFTSGLSQFSWLDYLDLQRWSMSFKDIAAHAWLTTAVRAGGTVVSSTGRMVTANYFSVLGVEPQLGRGFLPHEGDTPGTEAVIVLSDIFWSEHLDRAPDIVGSTVHLGDVPFTVIGVAPAGFVGVHPLAKAEFWVPATMVDILLPSYAKLSGGETFSRRDLDWFQLTGRLAKGVQLEQARAEMAAIAERLDWEQAGATVRLYRDIGWHPRDSRDLRTWTRFALPLVGLVLLLACANVASLILARAAPRRRDFAIRLAIGCAPTRLVRLLAIEGAVLAAAAGLAAISAAVAFRHVLPNLIPYFPGATTNLDMRPDLRVVGFTLLVCGLAWLLFAVAPALHASRLELVPSLKGLPGRRGTGRRVLSRLVVSQIALAVLLLIVAGLFTRSLSALSSREPGFEPEHLLLARLDMPQIRGYDEAQTQDFYRRLLEQVRGTAGVEAASLALNGPGTSAFMIDAADDPDADGGLLMPESILNPVAAQYFQAAGIEIVRGRGFALDEYGPSTTGVVINETLANRLWPERNPVGQTLPLPDHPVLGAWNRDLEVIGVAHDTLANTSDHDTPPAVWVPFEWFPSALSNWRPLLHVRTTGVPIEFAPRLREIVAGIDPDLPLISLETGTDWLRWFVFTERQAAMFADILAALSLLLSAIGVYGVISHVTHSRAHEIGVRIAMGARRHSILRLVIGDGLKLALAGTLLGAIGAAFVGRLVAAHLHGIGSYDVVAFALAPAVAVLMAGLACYLPARRAARTDPTAVLRQS